MTLYIQLYILAMLIKQLNKRIDEMDTHTIKRSDLPEKFFTDLLPLIEWVNNSTGSRRGTAKVASKAQGDFFAKCVRGAASALRSHDISNYRDKHGELLVQVSSCNGEQSIQIYEQDTIEDVGGYLTIHLYGQFHRMYTSRKGRIEIVEVGEFSGLLTDFDKIENYRR